MALGGIGMGRLGAFSLAGCQGWLGSVGVEHGAGSRPGTPGWRRNEEDGRVRESLFHKSIKPANSWFGRLTTNGPEPVTFVLSSSKIEIRRFMKHPQRPRPYARSGRDGGMGVVAASGGVVRHGPPADCGPAASTGSGQAHHERFHGWPRPEEAGLKPARTQDQDGMAGSEGLGALGAVGCQGWLGCGRVVGWHWVPAPFGRLRAGLTPGWRGKKTGGSGLGAGRGGSTRPSVDSGSAHHERGGAADAGCAEDGRVGDRAPTQERDGDRGFGGRREVEIPRGTSG